MENKILDTIVNSLKELNVEKIILFGSRAKETNTKFSDFDIAITGSIDKTKFLQIKQQLEENIFPYSIDLVIYDEIDEGFKKIIDKTGKVIWKK